MHSRAFLLLKRDLQNLDRLPIPGVTAYPHSEEDMFHWTARIEGLGGTDWEGGVFQVKLAFSEYYNYSPPSASFMTIPFHPNIDASSGAVSPCFARETWVADGSTLGDFLIALQSLLSNPELDTGCVSNMEATALFRDSPHTYRQMALDCVTASLRVDAGLSPYNGDTGAKPTLELPKLHPCSQSSTRQRRELKCKQISFDEYYKLWRGLATSVSTYSSSENQFMQLLERDSALRSVHFGTAQHRQHSLQQRMDEHMTLKYGTYKHPATASKHKKILDDEYRQQRVAQLQALYKNRNLESEDTTDPDKVDVDNLLQWTSALDETELTST